MKIKTLVVTGALAFALAATPAAAKTFRYAFQGDLNALDPYTLNESFTLGALGNVMEGLTKRDKDLKIIPGLAERWEIVDPLKWRFYLRKGVKFHNGEDFTADDVVFSTERMGSPGKLTWKHALRLGLHVGRGLGFIHKQRQIHGNLTPANRSGSSHCYHCARVWPRNCGIDLRQSHRHYAVRTGSDDAQNASADKYISVVGAVITPRDGLPDPSLL
jgi:hypothetical protein